MRIACTKVNKTNIRPTSKLLCPTRSKKFTMPAYIVTTELNLSSNQQHTTNFTGGSPAAKHFNWLGVSAAKAGKWMLLPTVTAEIGARKTPKMKCKLVKLLQCPTTVTHGFGVNLPVGSRADGCSPKLQYCENSMLAFIFSFQTKLLNTPFHFPQSMMTF